MSTPKTDRRSRKVHNSSPEFAALIKLIRKGLDQKQNKKCK